MNSHILARVPTVLGALLVAVAVTAIWAATLIAQPATRDRAPAATATPQLFIPPLMDLTAGVTGTIARGALVAAAGTHEFAPGAVSATLGYNGAYLGPTIVVERGGQYEIAVRNNLSDTTSVHWHGMDIEAAADGGPHQTIEPGDSWLARFGVHQTASTGWYHPHAMGTTAEQVAVDSLVVAAGERYEIVVDTRVLPAGADPLWITATSDAEVSMGILGITVDAGASAAGSGSAITRDLPATFERHAGLFMYHCHMLEHEEHGMMGQLLVSAVAAASVPHFVPNPGKGEMKWRT